MRPCGVHDDTFVHRADGSLELVQADVAGKGIAAALTVPEIRCAVHLLADVEGGLVERLQRLNRHLGDSRSSVTSRTKTTDSRRRSESERAHRWIATVIDGGSSKTTSGPRDEGPGGSLGAPPRGRAEAAPVETVEPAGTTRSGSGSGSAHRPLEE